MDYEIRILTKEHSAPMIHTCSQISDYAAIYRAQALACDADCIEVWQEKVCIFVDPQVEAPKITFSATALKD